MFILLLMNFTQFNIMKINIPTEMSFENEHFFL